MGSKRLDKISEYSRDGVNWRVVCWRCGRAAVLESLHISHARSRAGQIRDSGAITRRLWCIERGDRDVKCAPVGLGMEAPGKPKRYVYGKHLMSGHGKPNPTVRFELMSGPNLEFLQAGHRARRCARKE